MYDNIIKVSVIIPVYNAKDYLHQCLDSICKQTLKDIEIICIDDGSSDSSLSILKGQYYADNRIVIKSIPHQNSGIARNAGLEIARGEYIAFVDADDFLERDALEAAYDLATAEGSDICFFTYDEFDHNHKIFNPCPLALRTWEMPENRPFSGADAKDKIFNLGSLTPCDKIYRRDFIHNKKLAFQNIPACTDAFFVMSAFACAERISVLERILMHHRVGHIKSFSVGLEHHCLNVYKVLSELKKLLIERKLYEQYKQSFVNLVLDYSIGVISAFEDNYGTLMKEWFCRYGFKELGILGYPAEYYYYSNRYVELNRFMYEYEIKQKDIQKYYDKKISVIIPTYKAGLRADFELCLFSVLNQMYQNIEIVVLCDKGSDFEKVTEQYCQNDDRITVITDYDRSNTSNFAEYISNTSGDYFMVMSPFDFIFHDFLFSSIDVLGNNDTDALISDRCLYIHDLHGNLKIEEINIGKDPDDYNKIFYSEDYSDFLMSLSSYDGIIFSKKLLEEISEFQFTGADDIERDNLFVLKLVNHIKAFRYLKSSSYFSSKESKSFMYDNYVIQNREGINMTNAGNGRKALKTKHLLTEKCISLLMKNIDHLKGIAQKQYIEKTSIFFKTISKDKNFKEGLIPAKYFSDFKRIIHNPIEYYYNIKNKEIRLTCILTENQIKGNLSQFIHTMSRQYLDCYEILFVPSRESTVHKLEYLINAYADCRIISAIGSGFCDAANKALENACGEYILFPMVNDIYGAGALNKVYKYAHKNNSDICLIGSMSSDYTSTLPRTETFSINDVTDNKTCFVSYGLWDKLFKNDYIKIMDISFENNASYEMNNFTYRAVRHTDGISVSDLVQFRPSVEAGIKINKIPSLTNTSIVVRYYPINESYPSDYYTTFEFGKSTKLLTLDDIGDGYPKNEFIGWKIFRRKDNSWYISDRNGNTRWQKLINGKLPYDSEFVLYKDGLSLSKPIDSGEIHLVAEWM